MNILNHAVFSDTTGLTKIIELPASPEADIARDGSGSP